jgi:hypothetical protein
MTWANFYLVCFVVGFCFSLFSFLTGGLRCHLHIPHLPHGTGGHIGAGVAHGPAVGHAPAAGTTETPDPVQGASSSAGHVSPFNFATFTAFLAWFGGTGYLLTRYSRVWFVMGLGVALTGGVVGGSIIYLFLSKVLTSQEENMDPADYEMVGVLGKISSPVREGGTGEIIYSQAGTRRTCGARSEDGSAVAKGAEVVVTRYEKGIAYVRLWDELTADGQLESKS